MSILELLILCRNLLSAHYCGTRGQVTCCNFFQQSPCQLQHGLNCSWCFIYLSVLCVLIACNKLLHNIIKVKRRALKCRMIQMFYSLVSCKYFWSNVLTKGGKQLRFLWRHYTSPIWSFLCLQKTWTETLFSASVRYAAAMGRQSAIPSRHTSAHQRGDGQLLNSVVH